MNAISPTPRSFPQNYETDALVVWRIVVSALASINEVNQRRSRLY